MKVEDLKLQGVKLVAPERVHDPRGWFCETYRDEWRTILGVESFVQDNEARNLAVGVLRGLHYQWPRPQAKLVKVMVGSVLDVVVDIRPDSTTFGMHLTVELSAENGLQLLIPRGFAHGYVTQAADTYVTYKVDDYYMPGADRGLAFDDPTLGIAWPSLPALTLSDRDRSWPSLKSLQSPF